MSRTSDVFKKNVKALRAAHGYSLRKAAELSGISFSALGRFERGERFPEPETLDKLASLYSIAVADLFRAGGAEEKAASLALTKARVIEQFIAIS